MGNYESLSCSVVVYAASNMVPTSLLSVATSCISSGCNFRVASGGSLSLTLSSLIDIALQEGTEWIVVAAPDCIFDVGDLSRITSHDDALAVGAIPRNLTLGDIIDTESEEVGDLVPTVGLCHSFFAVRSQLLRDMSGAGMFLPHAGDSGEVCYAWFMPAIISDDDEDLSEGFFADAYESFWAKIRAYGVQMYVDTNLEINSSQLVV